MKFTAVKEVPGNRTYNPLKSKWDEFMAMNVKVAKVDLDEKEYCSIEVARSVMSVSIKHFGYPITITKRGNEIYLIRRDM